MSEHDELEALRARLEQLEVRYRLLSAASSSAFYIHDGQATLEVGGAFEELLGYTAEDAMGRAVMSDWIAPEEIDGIKSRVAAGFQGTYRTVGVHKDGSRIPVELSVREMELRGSTVRAVVLRDLRPELEAQRRLAQSEAQMRTLLDVAFDGMVVHFGGKVLEANEGFARMCGYTLPEVIGMTPDAVVTPESVDVIAEKIRTDDTRPYLVEGVRKNGERFPMQIQGRRVPGDSGIRVSGFRDLTHQRQAEEEREALQRQLLQAQKLEGLGVMAGGIAHDFNNLLTVVLGNAELALMRLPDDHPVHHLVESVGDAAERAANLTRQMLAYAGKMPSSPERLDLGAAVLETRRLLEVALPKGASFAIDLPDEPVWVQADSAQVGQVAMNLITNAAEALEEGSGSVRIRIARVPSVRPFRPYIVGGTDIAAGAHALLEVSDDGCGMDAQTLARVFDPFFTTRMEGRGLGLPTVLGIVRAHHGAIAVDSTPGRGTRIAVLLPLDRAAPIAESPPTQRSSGPMSFCLGSVVIVDDEPDVAEVAANMLATAGCSIETLESGEALLERLQTGPVPELIVLDRVMPGLGGDETLRRVRERWPSLPVVLTSGRASPDLGGDAHTVFLAKPFRMESLSDALRAHGLVD